VTVQDRPHDSERGGRHMLIHSLRNASLWIAMALLAVNGLGWALASSAREPAYVVEPKLDPDLADLRDRIIEDTHHGEPFELRLTNLEAEQGITWFVNRHPSIPFRYPQVEIHPYGVEVRGEAHLAGLRVGLEGRASVSLRDGVPIIVVKHLGMAGVSVPGFVRQRIQAEIDNQLGKAHHLPMTIETLELEEGRGTATGTIR
jgi:hypothetical protein